MEVGSRKKIFISGLFHVLHPGHQRLFEFAADLGDLVVGVLGDALSNDVEVSEELRLEEVKANPLVSHAFLVKDSVSTSLREIRPDIVVKGKEFEDQINIETSILNEYGGVIVFSSGEALYSTREYIRAELRSQNLSVIKTPRTFIDRHKITSGRLNELVDSFADITVCVIGDLIVDEYISCEPLGLSGEDPTIVVTPVDSERFIGGAGIVAAHASGLGAKKTYLFTVIGDDEVGEFASGKLSDHGISAFTLLDPSRPTTHKQRFRSRGKSLLRVSRLTQNPISGDLQIRMLKKISEIVSGVDVLIFSDFNYGCLPTKLLEQISKVSRQNSVKMCADSQSSSQIGNISRFVGMDLITPTEREARISMQDADSGLQMLAERLRKKSRAKSVFLKQGEQGLLVQTDNPANGTSMTDQIGAINGSPIDVAGAGDCLLATASLALAAGGNIWEAALLGSIGAAVQIGQVGNRPITTRDLKNFLTLDKK